MNDSHELLRAFRAEVAGPGSDAVAAAKRRFIEESVSRSPGRAAGPHRFRRVVAVAAACAVVASVTMARLWSGSDVAEPANAAELRAVAAVAAEAPKPPAALGRGQYILTRYTYVASSTINLTQERLDELSRDQYRQLSEIKGHYVRVHGPRASQAEIDRSDRLQREFRRRVKRGVKLGDLPTESVSVTQTQPYVSWVNKRHIGGGGGSSAGETEYGGVDQRTTVKLLSRAGIFTNPSVLHQATTFSDGNQLEEFTWPSADIAKLPAETDALKAALRVKPLPLSRPGEQRRIADDSELFHVAIGLLRSPFATPEQRSAIVLMLGGLAGVTIESDVDDASGRHGLGLKLATDYGFEQVVFDQSNSQVLGTNHLIERPAALAGGIAPYLKFAESVSFGVVFEPTIIVRGRPTCPVDLNLDVKAEEFCEKHIRPVTASSTAD